jgi:type III secretory pathway component EscT
VPPDLSTWIADIGPKITPLLFLFLLIYARRAAIVSMTPFFASKLMPGPVKVTLALAFAAILFPQYLTRTTIDLSFGWGLMGLFVKELLIGLIIGFLGMIPFEVAQSAGVLIDHQREASSLQVMDPTIGEQTSPLGILYNNVLLALFFGLGGPFLFLDAIATSLDVLPPDKGLTLDMFATKGPMWTYLTGIVNFVLKLGTQLAGPALVSLLLADLLLGIANRLAPQVQISFLGMGLKSLFGLASLFIAWYFLVRVLTTEATTYMRGLNVFFEKLAG